MTRSEEPETNMKRINSNSEGVDEAPPYSVAMSGGEIYYDTIEREKFRSVHPPQTDSNNHFSSGRLDNADTPSSSSYHVVLPPGVEKKFLNFDSFDHAISGSDTSASGEKSNFFQIATPDDCHENGSSGSHEIRSTNSKYASRNIVNCRPAAPPFLSATHILLSGNDWDHVDNGVCAILQKSGASWEHLNTESLWMGQYSTGHSSSSCIFQIRAFIDLNGNAVIEMQKLGGDDADFYKLYHAIRNDILSPQTNDSATVTDNSSYEAAVHTDSDIEFLLIPLLEMMQSDYLDMELEALRLAYQLSTNIPTGSTPSQTDEIAHYAGKSARIQMRNLGFINVLIHLFCESYSRTYLNSPVPEDPTGVGIKALSIISNFSCDVTDFQSLLTSSKRSHEFCDLLNYFARTCREGHVQPSQLQVQCKKLIGLI